MTKQEKTNEKTLVSIKVENDELYLLNQLLLPTKFIYEKIDTLEKAFQAIKQMKVRGAPAIAIAGILYLSLECKKKLTKKGQFKEDKKWVLESLEYLGKSRPTAVNLFNSINKLNKLVSEIKEDSEESRKKLLEIVLKEGFDLAERDGRDNKNIGIHGRSFILKTLKGKKKLNVLTHCNTGALATMKYGTALGIIRELYSNGNIQRVYATETRPYNQGARLTSFECVYEGIPVTLVLDSAVSYLLKTHKIDVVIVGADRICANGDTANKIGTYQVALSAKYHGVPFIVAAPTTSIDYDLKSGDLIKIEERNADEVLLNAQTQERVVAEGVEVWNPGFDVTDADLISCIVTEEEAITKSQNSKFYDLKKK